MEYSKYYEKINFENIYLFFDAFNKFDNKKLISISEFHPIYETYKDAYLELFKIKYLQIDLIDAKKRFFFDLSQGERKFFTESLMIFNAINKNVKNNILLVLDEPDLTLHPDWQKKYIIEMIKLLSNFPKKKFHLIITSHSPFILSDLPKENVIFLEKGKQVKPFKTNEQTFGANIHTLLSHGFFMSDELMGEFSKSKINEIKKFYEKVKKSKNPQKAHLKKYNDKKKDFENIQKIIGEPFLQTIIKNYLDELEEIFTNEAFKMKKKKEFLDQFSPKELQKYLDEKNAKA
jgi:ABC-type glutathione transport system ATPase component